MTAALRGLTRGLLIFALFDTIATSIVVRLAGSDTTLHFLGAFVLGRAGQDSWMPMGLALQYVRAHPGAPIYAALFFEQNIQFIYPPTSLLLLEPFAALSASGLPSDGMLNVVSWIAVALTAAITTRLWILRSTEHLRRQVERRRIDRLVLAAIACGLTLAFFPILKAFRLGQIQTWMTCAFAAATLAWVGGDKRTSGAWSGFICLVKPQLALLVVWGLIRRQRRFVEGWAMVALPLGALSVWRYGLASHLDYLRVASFITRHSWSYYPNQSASGLLNRWLFIGNSLTWDPHAVPFNAWVFAGTVLTAVALVGAALLQRPAEDPDAQLVDFFIAALSFTLASPLAWDHHYGILMPMFACILPVTLASWRGRAGPLVVLAASFVLTSNFFHPIAARFASTRFNVLQSYVFGGALLLLVYLHRLRRQLSG